MTNKEREKISKFLSLLLRHKPQEAGLTPDNEGWVEVAELLEKTNITFKQLQEVVEFNDKQRFAFSGDMLSIKANQGHSIPVELNLQPSIPPDVLYHGTAEKNIISILANGLQKQQRHHVHLSNDAETAFKVGLRHGKPVVLTILAYEMYLKRYSFYRTDNNVWLVDSVLPEFIQDPQY